MKPFKSLENTRYMQYLAAITATISIAICSMFTVWTSPILPKLMSSDSPIGVTVTKEEASWIAAGPLLGLVPGGLLTTLYIEKLGRRTILLLCAIPLSIPWIACLFANSAMTLIIVRSLAGLIGAVILTVLPMYLSEIADKDIRGRLGSIYSMLKLGGDVYIYCVGPFVSYAALTLSCSVFPFIFGVLFFFMPESPYYLIKNNNKDEATKNLIRLNPNTVDKATLNNKLAEIVDTIEYDMKNKSTLKELLVKQEYRKPLLIMLGVSTFHQFNGLHAVSVYMQTIIGLTDSSISPEVSSIFCGLIQIPAVLIAATLVDKMGRKFLLIVSLFGCGVTLIAEGLYFYLQDVVHANTDSISWLPTTALMVFLIMNPIGINTIPFVLTGELFSPNIKGIAVSVLTIYGGALAFVVIIIFEPISSTWGTHIMFWIYGGTCIVGCFFIFFILPETKGKTFVEIQQKLMKSKSVKPKATNVS